MLVVRFSISNLEDTHTLIFFFTKHNVTLKCNIEVHSIHYKHIFKLLTLHLIKGERLIFQHKEANSSFFLSHFKNSFSKTQYAQILISSFNVKVNPQLTLTHSFFSLSSWCAKNIYATPRKAR